MYILPIFLIILAVIGVGIFNLKNLSQKSKLNKLEQKVESENSELTDKRKKAKADILALAKFVEEEWKKTGKFPKDANELYDKWNESHTENLEPQDPFSNKAYNYQTFEEGKNYEIWSNGSDGKKMTSDDIYTTHKTMDN